MTKDLIAERVRWLDGVFTHPGNPDLFQDKSHLIIQKELANGWVKEDRLTLLKELSDRYGEENVLAVIDQIIYSNIKRNSSQIGQDNDNSLETFIKLLWGPLKNSGFDYCFETSGNQTKFRVTKCPIYDLAKQIGAEKWLYHLVCLTDEPSVSGFNSQIEFTRTRTLMQGYPDCDHCYTDHSAG